MKDRIEIVTGHNKQGREILKFYVHCNEGTLWLFDKPKTKGIYRYFSNGKSVNELHEHKYKGNKALNKIIDRLPVYIKYAKEIALEDRTEWLSLSYEHSEHIYDFDERSA